MSEQGEVTCDIQDNIATITFYHPKKNSLPGDILRQLAGEIQKQGERDDVHAILLKSPGDGPFCAGASFDELVAIENKQEGKRFFQGFALVINAIRKCPKFVVARVQGKTVGGGVGIVAAADYTLATVQASVKLSELALGIGPFVVGPAVERKIGKAAFGEMAIDTEWHDANWAFNKGLYSYLYHNQSELDEAVGTLMKKLSRYSPEAIRHMKSVLWKDTEDWDTLLDRRAEISGELVLSDYTRQAIDAFKQKTS